MTAAKHTPGPWQYDTDPTGWEYRIVQADRAPYTPGYSDVAHFSVNTVRGEARDVQEANARLIASAPDLLEALDRIVNQFDHEIGPEHVDEYYSDARAAIAKARGEA